jgi:hypothetical protein
VANDEWVGIDDITVTSTAIPEPASVLLAVGSILGVVGLRSSGSVVLGNNLSL